MVSQSVVAALMDRDQARKTMLRDEGVLGHAVGFADATVKLSPPLAFFWIPDTHPL